MFVQPETLETLEDSSFPGGSRAISPIFLGTRRSCENGGLAYITVPPRSSLPRTYSSRRDVSFPGRCDFGRINRELAAGNRKHSRAPFPVFILLCCFSRCYFVFFEGTPPPTTLPSAPRPCPGFLAQRVLEPEVGETFERICMSLS